MQKTFPGFITLPHTYWLYDYFFVH